MLLAFLYVALSKMVMMFCSYAITVLCFSMSLVLSLTHALGAAGSCRVLTILWQQKTKKQTGRDGTITLYGAVSVCYLYAIDLYGGSTVVRPPHPPSKAQPEKPATAHYVALKNWPIFHFRFCGCAA